MKANFGVGLYSSKTAARVARVKHQCFQAWSRAHLLEPTQVGREKVYSYHDLLRIRLILRLREAGFKPKQIRTALDTLSMMSGGAPDAWLKSTIYIESGITVAVLAEHPQWNPVAVPKGPQKMALVFFPDLAKELEKELVPPDRFKHIQINPEVLGGAPVVSGTRIPTRAVALVKESGEEPRRAYPELTAEQVREAIEYEEFLEAA